MSGAHNGSSRYASLNKGNNKKRKTLAEEYRLLPAAEQDVYKDLAAVENAKPLDTSKIRSKKLAMIEKIKRVVSDAYFQFGISCSLSLKYELPAKDPSKSDESHTVHCKPTYFFFILRRARLLTGSSPRSSSGIN